jgi:Uri superfamily endonuclease
MPQGSPCPSIGSVAARPRAVLNETDMDHWHLHYLREKPIVLQRRIWCFNGQ